MDKKSKNVSVKPQSISGINLADILPSMLRGITLATFLCVNICMFRAASCGFWLPPRWVSMDPWHCGVYLKSFLGHISHSLFKVNPWSSCLHFLWCVPPEHLWNPFPVSLLLWQQVPGKVHVAAEAPLEDATLGGFLCHQWLVWHSTGAWVRHHHFQATKGYTCSLPAHLQDLQWPHANKASHGYDVKSRKSTDWDAWSSVANSQSSEWSDWIRDVIAAECHRGGA